MIYSRDTPESTPWQMADSATMFQKRSYSQSGEWRRGDSNPKHPLSQPIHNDSNCATDCNEKPSGGGFSKQVRALPEQRDNSSERELGANMVREISAPHPDLAEIVKAWPQLPEATRSAIQAIVRSVVGAETNRDKEQHD